MKHYRAVHSFLTTKYPLHVWTSCSKVVGALPKVSHIDVRVCSPWSQKGIHVWGRNEVLRVQEGLEVWAFSAESEKVCRFQKKVRPYFLVENLIFSTSTEIKYRSSTGFTEYRLSRCQSWASPSYRSVTEHPQSLQYATYSKSFS